MKNIDIEADSSHNEIGWSRNLNFHIQNMSNMHPSIKCVSKCKFYKHIYLNSGLYQDWFQLHDLFREFRLVVLIFLLKNLKYLLYCRNLNKLNTPPKKSALNLADEATQHGYCALMLNTIMFMISLVSLLSAKIQSMICCWQ